MGSHVSRLEGWEERLAAVIEEYRSRPYELGRSDCLSLACAAYAALRGVDYWPRFAGTYSTQREAVARIREIGRNLDDAVIRTAQLDRIPISHASRGDLVLYRDGAGAHLTVCIGASVAAFGPEGLVFLPTDHPGLGPALKV